MTTHSISVIPVETFYGEAFKWVCTCGASGEEHDGHQTALNHGVIHTWISAPEKTRIESEERQS